MKTSLKAAMVLLSVVILPLLARNPFEFAEQGLQKYIVNKVHSTSKKKSAQSTWEIIEIKNDTTRIMKDDHGNVRSISLAEEK